MNFLKSKVYQPFLISVFSFLVFVFLIFQFTNFYNNNKEKDVRSNLLDLLNTKKSLLEKALNSRIYYTKGIAAYTSINPKITEKTFYELADKLIQKDSVISTMSLSKDCIIGAVFPKKGHEAAIGLNLLKHPQRRKIVESTIETKNTFVAGPVKLVEGGIGFISYTPIFTKVKKDSSRFWGVTDIVIKRDKLFNEIQFYKNNKHYKFALKGEDGTGENGHVFWGDSTIFNSNPVIVDVLLPTGNWELASVPITGWDNYVDKNEILSIILYFSAIIISLLIWLLANALIKIRDHEKELNALFGAMEDLVIEFNEKGEYKKIAPTNEALLVLPKEKMLGKTLYEVFNKEKADFFMDAILECIKTKEKVVLEYKLDINSKTTWFLARISYISDKSVLFIAQDNTTKKLAEEKLKESEQSLLELNKTKDKLFSIIAHDLRSPFNTTLGLVEILNEDFDEMTKEDIRDSIEVISHALKSQFNLLENLLNWAVLQTGKMEIRPTTINLKNFADDTITLFSAKAIEKGIALNNNIDDKITVNADANMLRSIISNLVFNAIKFTNKGGKVTIDARVNKESTQIVITDDGIGMKEEDATTIFNIDKNQSTRGTSGEKGTGLGLALVKEMIEMHNGSVSVKSELGKGTEFTINLPK